MRKQPGGSHHKPDSGKAHKKDARRSTAGSDNKPVRQRGGNARPEKSSAGRDKEDRGFRSRTDGNGAKSSFDRKRRAESGPGGSRKPAGATEGKEAQGERRSFRKDAGKSSYTGSRKPASKRSFGNTDDNNPARSFDRPRKTREASGENDDQSPKSASRGTGDRSFARKDKRFGSKETGMEQKFSREPGSRRSGETARPAAKQGKRFKQHDEGGEGDQDERKERRTYPAVEEKPIESAMTLNKYIAHSGESSRRDAAEMVKQGKVRVNGELVLEPGYRVVPGDQVTLSGKKLTPQKGLVYILMNKPKGCITTTEDPEERKTVMDLVTGAGVDRLFPVGRLDRNTTGVLLLTNDGALAHRLAHPSYNIKKVYHVTLDKNLTRADYEKISKGLTLEDGPATVDAIAYLENRHEIGLEIHSGKNRIVRRIFESLGYTVEKLDRVMYAGLTKKNVPRGKWRFLLEKEVIFLKHFK